MGLNSGQPGIRQWTWCPSRGCTGCGPRIGRPPGGRPRSRRAKRGYDNFPVSTPCHLSVPLHNCRSNSPLSTPSRFRAHRAARRRSLRTILPALNLRTVPPAPPSDRRSLLSRPPNCTPSRSPPAPRIPTPLHSTIDTAPRSPATTTPRTLACPSN